MGERKVGLTPREKMVLQCLADAWEFWSGLRDKHPSDDHEFAASVHSLQCLIAFRVARRADPEWWSEVGCPGGGLIEPTDALEAAAASPGVAAGGAADNVDTALESLGAIILDDLIETSHIVARRADPE